MKAAGYIELERRQKNYMNHFWSAAGIEIEGEGSEAVRQGIHFNLFHKNMYFPYDEECQIHSMDDRFMMRKPWDESKIPEEKRAWLYENYHPLFIMRHRMSKQADAILGMYLHSNLFTEDKKKPKRT